MAHDVFISYSHDDKPVADAACATLEGKQIRCWIAPRDAQPGTDYAESIIDALHQSRLLVLVFSARSNQSPQVMREVERAVSLGMPIIPFRIEDVVLSKAMEYYISAPHWLDAMTPPLEKHLQALAETVRLNLNLRGASEHPTEEQHAVAEQRVTFGRLLEDPTLMLHAEIGPFLVQDFVGAGGSGLVYRAWDPRFGRSVCVKVLYPIRPEDGDVAALIARGVRGLGALDHPNIVKVFDTGPIVLYDSRSTYIAMEFIEGVTLDRWSLGLSDTAALTATRLRMACAIAEALSAAHEGRYVDEAGFERTGLLHGDIKPANIMVRPNGTPVLLDFMLVDLQRLFDPAVIPPALLERGGRAGLTAAFGTPTFMAPEQEARGIVTVKTDIFSLGVTLCYLFFPESDSPVGDLIFERAPEWEDLRALIAAMLDNSDARPADMRTVAQRLNQIAAGLNPERADHQGLAQAQEVDRDQTEPSSRFWKRLRQALRPHDKP